MKTIHIYFDNMDDSIKLGCLFISEEKMFELYSFQFDTEFLSSNYSHLFIDNELFLYHERQYLSPDKKIYAFISDSMPDRWGKRLLMHQETNNASKENRKPKRLNDIDYLLGVSDYSRIGCLRYKLDESGDYLSNDKTGVPPLERLRDVEYASIKYEENELDDSEDYLKILLSPGSSLGGARPKASFIDNNDELWIAKFPSKQDEYDVGKWEMVAFDLANLCGIDVPEHRLATYSKYGATFMSKRFDRDKNKRIAFMSAMTALGKEDGEDAQSGVSYLDIASFIKSNGLHAKEDLKQLFTRIAFNIAISNTDDHLRNQGFILSNRYWKLSPAYDLNPSPFGNELSLLIDQNSNEMNDDVLLDTHDQYYLSLEEAKDIVEKVNYSVRNNWKILAKKYQISEQSIKYMEKAFIK